MDADVLDELYSMVDDERLASEPMSLSQAMDEYGAQLPLMFAVSESLYGICETTSLMANQLLSIHAEKETKVIDVVTDWGAQYMIPLTAMLECSPLYDPHGKFETAKGGYNFKTAGDLIQAGPLPFMVYVETTDHTNTQSESQVESGEILIVKQVVCHSNTQKRLECVCYQSTTTKLLEESCIGNFTTSTAKLKFPLNNMIGLLTLPTPLVIYVPKDTEIQLAPEGKYTITNYRTVRSVIASSIRHSMDRKESSIDIMEVLQDVPIEVQLVELSEKELRQLRLQTKSFCDGFHPSVLSKIVVSESSVTNAIQTQLFKHATEGDGWKVGTCLIPPVQVDDHSPDDHYELVNSTGNQSPPASDEISKSFTVTNALYDNVEFPSSGTSCPDYNSIDSSRYTNKDYTRQQQNVSWIYKDTESQHCGLPDAYEPNKKHLSNDEGEYMMR